MSREVPGWCPSRCGQTLVYVRLGARKKQGGHWECKECHRIWPKKEIMDYWGKK